MILRIIVQDSLIVFVYMTDVDLTRRTNLMIFGGGKREGYGDGVNT